MIVPLQDGSLLALVGAYTWADNLRPHPTWWDRDYPGQSPSQSSIRGPHGNPGQRGFLAFWHIRCFKDVHSGQPQITWTNTGILDAAFTESTDSKQQRRSAGYAVLNPEGIGGWDRPEMYADPFHPNRVYLSLGCARLSAPNTYEESLEVFYRSEDLGKTWQVGMSLPHAEFY
jgi:hypothetical protein